MTARGVICDYADRLFQSPPDAVTLNGITDLSRYRKADAAGRTGNLVFRTLSSLQGKALEIVPPRTAHRKEIRTFAHPRGVQIPVLRLSGADHEFRTAPQFAVTIA
jgi:hypothetical protein